MTQFTFEQERKIKRLVREEGPGFAEGIVLVGVLIGLWFAIANIWERVSVIEERLGIEQVSAKESQETR